LNYKLNTASALYHLTKHNRELMADHLIKANAPNAKDLCTGQLDFVGALQDLKNSKGSADKAGILRGHTERVSVNKSVREASVDLSTAYLANASTIKLLNHYYKQSQAIVDGYRPQ
jgi:hypothetical protein